MLASGDGEYVTQKCLNVDGDNWPSWSPGPATRAHVQTASSEPTSQRPILTRTQTGGEIFRMFIERPLLCGLGVLMR